MLKKLNALTIAAYLSVTGFAAQLKQDLTEDERGLSGIVVAVVLLWGKLSEWLEAIWGKISGKASEIN